MNRNEMKEVEIRQRVHTMTRWLANKLETSSKEVALDYFQEELYYALRETYLTGRIDSTLDDIASKKRN